MQIQVGMQITIQPNISGQLNIIFHRTEFINNILAIDGHLLADRIQKGGGNANQNLSAGGQVLDAFKITRKDL